LLSSQLFEVEQVPSKDEMEVRFFPGSLDDS